MVKAPATVARLRQEPDSVVVNPLSYRASLLRYSEADSRPDDRLARFFPQEEHSAGLADLLRFVFPRFSKDQPTQGLDPDALCFRRPLLTTLRMGLLPGTSSRADVEGFLSSDSAEIERTLWGLYENEKLASFFERLEAAYVTADLENHSSVWLGVSRFLRREDGLCPNAYSPMRDINQAFGELFLRACGVLPGFRANARSILHELLSDGDVELASYLLNDQAFHHGLSGLEKRDSGIGFMPAEEAERVSLELSNCLRDRHLSSNWISTLRDPHPVVLMVRAGIWDQASKDKLEAVLQDETVFDAFVLLLFGGHYVMGRDFIALLVDLDKFLEHVNARIALGSSECVHPTVQDALRKALKRS